MDSLINKVLVLCPKGLEDLLKVELALITGVEAKMQLSGVSIDLTLNQAYQVILWSRLANRVLWVVNEGKIKTADDIYRLALQVTWYQHFDVNSRFRVDFSGTNALIKNSNFGGMKVKDAIVDQFRDRSDERPSVDRREPDVLINVRLHKGEAQYSIDLSGDSLHRRGYRPESGKAPLKENLAAAILMRAGWKEDDAGEFPPSFVDPMCGSATFLIEAAMMATDRAPALTRGRFGFLKWRMHDEDAWEMALSSAWERHEAALKNCRSRFIGYDADPKVVVTAMNNIKRSGLDKLIHVEKRALADFSVPEKIKPGLLVTNPPYGERLGEVASLTGLYQCLGEKIKACLLGWQAAIFTGMPQLGFALGLQSKKQYKFFNGAIPTQLLLFDVNEGSQRRTQLSSANSAHQPDSIFAFPVANKKRAEMFANRLKKNINKFEKWANKKGIECYRVYDADMPEYSVAIDRYGDWVHVQEYAAPKSVDEQAAQERFEEVLSVLPVVMKVDSKKIVTKQRTRQKGKAQYVKQAEIGHKYAVNEFGCRLMVNLTDYLDVGLFLDHRPMRKWIQAHAKGKRFLNLFCYTGAATVHAVKGGATSSLSIDLSQNYLDWAKENLLANGFSDTRHEYLSADCLYWLKKSHDHFELIFLDPPTFSNSKKMVGVLDVQRDHVDMIRNAMRILTKDGTLIFSNNLRNFQLDESALSDFIIENVSAQSIDEDFKRNAKIHQCWFIRHQ
jgi:23S rRNA (guanine2445-N2)-methyltransferase / 23S rRNA (guanine2069-N7)-methyltransferase